MKEITKFFLEGESDFNEDRYKKIIISVYKYIANIFC